MGFLLAEGVQDLGRRGYALAEEATAKRLGGRRRAGLAAGGWVGVLEVEGEVEARGGRGDSHGRNAGAQQQTTR